MTPAHCDSQILRLKVLKGLPEDVFEYFAALQDVPDDVFTKAVSHALRTRVWFPTPAELRLDCDAAGSSRVLEPREESRIEALVGGGREVIIVNPLNTKQQIRVKIDRIWKLDCNDCEDTGWRSRQCPAAPCGRRHEHGPHEWVERCQCIDWNPTIRRRKEAGAKYAQPAEKVHA